MRRLEMSTETTVEKSVKETVQDKYGAAAREVRKTSAAACCNSAFTCCDPITGNLYNESEKGALPQKAVLASLGCGNPTALIELKAGETVLDLGSGGGIDVLLSVLGGILGVGFAFLTIWVLKTFTALPAVTDVWAVVLGLGFSGVVGVAAGFLPALKAANLDVIDALRYE